MKLVLYGLYDEESQLYEHQLFTFVDERVAYSSLRRSLRESYLNGSVSLDWMKEHRYSYLGTFDNVSGDINFEDLNEVNYVHRVISCEECVSDLVEV